MKKIRIQKIEMHYFKGIGDMKMEFGPETTIVSAPNASGKSSIIDAFYWCLWGKNAAGDQKFSVKTLDGHGEEIPHVNHEVTITLDADGERHEFRRVMVPEYDDDDRLKGNHTDYSWNDVPLKKSEYDAKVSSLIKESVFRLITSPYAFLEQDWQKQRETLMRLAGDVGNDEVEGDYGALKAILKTKTLEEYAKEVSNRLKRVNDAMEGIPYRISEVKRGMPEPCDVESLKAEKARHTAELEEAARLMASASERSKARSEQYDKIRNEITDTQNKMFAIFSEAQAKERNAIHEANVVADNLTKAIESEERRIRNVEELCQEDMSKLVKKIEETCETVKEDKSRLEQLREEWSSINSQTFSADEFLRCPLYGHLCQDGTACAQYDNRQGEAYEKFMADKKERLEKNRKAGKELAEKIGAAKADIDKMGAELVLKRDELTAHKTESANHIKDLKAKLEANPRRPLVSTLEVKDVPGLESLQQRLAELQAKLEAEPAPEKIQEDEYGIDLRKHTAEIRERLAAIERELASADMAANAQKRIAELEEELKRLGVQKADLEMERDMCRNFEIARMNMITDKVNRKFRIVRWQMFQRQINGEEVPACICLCGGVPWRDANDAGRLDAGIDVAHTLAEGCNADVPMFIDGAERSTNIYYPGGQRILMQVSKCREMNVEYC